MARDALHRNLTDGQIVLNDGGGRSVTLVLEDGDLDWTQNYDYDEVLDRGTLSQLRDGDDQPIDLSFSVVWVQLIGFTASTADQTEVYELVNNNAGSFTTTNDTGGAYTFQTVFTCSSPASTAGADEVITFQKCYTSSCNQTEGRPNTVSWTGRDFETAPTIARA